MSHYAKLTVKYLDADSLKTALIKLGYKAENIEVSKELKPLQDYTGTDTKLKAHVIVRRKAVGNLCNDLGWCVGEKAESYICDYANNPEKCYNTEVKKLGGHGKSFQDRLAQEYAVAVTEKHYKARGKTVTRVTEPDGRIKLYAS